MKSRDKKRISKALSLALRHRPDKFNLDLDEQGWCKVDQLLQNFQQNQIPLDRELLEELVRTSDKQRFALSNEGTLIRANQGHSISVELGYTPQNPPATLFHGTATRFLTSILSTGLQKQKRHHVHLSADKNTAMKVGQRHGKVVILQVQAQQMQQDGYAFYCSENGVWLTEEVPPQYLETLLA